MSGRWWGMSAAALVVVGVAAGVVGAGERAAHSAAIARADADRWARDADIAFYRTRVARDPIGAADRAQLAALYLQRSRETASYDDVLRAEDLARRAITLRAGVGHDVRTFGVLAAALLAEHRFIEARAVVRALHQANPETASYFAQLGEIDLELGDYDAATAIFDSLWSRRSDPAVAPRLARWAEIEGRTDLARRLLDTALVQALGRTDLPREQVAWYYLRAGDLALREGRHRDAGYAFRHGLDVFPGDARLLAGLARLAAADRSWRRAIDFGERAIATVADPATLGLLSDAYAAVGDTDHAGQYARAMELSVLAQPGQWHRSWSLFLLDRDRRVPEVLARARRELETRRDVYAWDVLAWALHKSGRDAEARAAMGRALARGTRDPLLQHHALELGP